MRTLVTGALLMVLLVIQLTNGHDQINNDAVIVEGAFSEQSIC
jgi:hypothetical protein